MPKSTRQDVIDAAEELSHYTPQHKTALGQWVCPYCWYKPPAQAESSRSEITDWLNNPENHKESCPWRIIKEALANLD